LSLDAIVDTGFGGFVFLSRQQALRIGLVQLRTGDVVELANGSRCICEVCPGYVSLDRQTVRRGEITIVPASTEDVFVGMAFLHAFDLALIVGERFAALHDAGAVERFLRRAQHRRR